jgi:uncharacterized protein
MAGCAMQRLTHLLSWRCVLDSKSLKVFVMSDAAVPPARKVPCPNCRKPALYGPANPWRPFCTERCRSADLGAWASERFRVPAQAPTDDDETLPKH